MAKHGFKLAGAAIAIVLIGVLALLIFDAIWFRISAGAALVILFGGILLLAWRTDRKDKAKRAGIDELPRI